MVTEDELKNEYNRGKLEGIEGFRSHLVNWCLWHNTAKISTYDINRELDAYIEKLNLD